MKLNSAQPNSVTAWRFIRFSLLLPLVFMFYFGGVRRAAAQGTMGMLPNPMTTTELNGYAERLGLSSGQGAAMEEIHDGYKRAYRELREGEIKRFMEEMQGMSGGMPHRKQFESFLNNLTRLNKKIFGLDRGLFDEMIPLLDETQMAMLPRVRQARQRHCYGKSPMLMMSGGVPLDLTELWLGLEMSTEERAATDPLMSQYEATLTKKMGAIYRAMPDSFQDMFDAMEDLDIDEEKMEDPEQAAEMVAQMMEIQREIMQKSTELSQEIRDLNRRTVRGVRGMLEGDTGRAFYLRYLGKAYPETRGLTRARGGMKRAARRIHSITEAQRTAIDGLVDRHREEVDTILRAIVQEVDARGPRNMFGMNVDDPDEERQKHADELEKLQGRASEMDRAMTGDLTELLGGEQAALLQQVARRIVNGDEAAVKKLLEPKEETAGKSDAGAPGTVRSIGLLDSKLPRSISRTDLDRYLSWLEVEEDMKPVAEMLLKDYHEQFEHLQHEHMKKMSEVMPDMKQPNQGTGESYAAQLKMNERLERLRRETRGLIQQRDRELFDQLAALLNREDDAETASIMARVRRHRTRQWYVVSDGSMMSFGGGVQTHPEIDLGELIGQIHLEPEQEKSVWLGLDAYDQTLTELMTELDEASGAYQRLLATWSMEIQAAQEDGDRSVAIAAGQDYQGTVGPALRTVQDIRTGLLKLNQEAMEKLVADLSSEHGAALRRSFNRAVFPGIYDDSHSVEGVLGRARKLDDLSDGQRERLNAFAVEYLPAYAAVCDRMARKAEKFSGWPMGGDQEEMVEWQRSRAASAKLNFERNELNARGINRLKTILNEEQIGRLGGLPEPPEDSQFPF